MKKFSTILFSLLTVSVFAQSTPQDIPFGIEIKTSTEWDCGSTPIRVDGTLTFTSSKPQYEIIVPKSTFTVGSTGVVNATNAIRLGNWNANGGVLTIEEGGKVVVDKITYTGSSSVELYSPDALQSKSNKYTHLYFFANGALKLYGAGDYSFRFSGASGNTANITFTDNVNLNITRLESSVSFKMNLIDFNETNSIFFSSLIYESGSKTTFDCTLELVESGSDYTLSYYKGDELSTTITLKGADLSGFTFEQTTVNGVNGYLLSVAVPEPAEWAMIFGGIALGLAIYRRRK